MSVSMSARELMIGYFDAWEARRVAVAECSRCRDVLSALPAMMKYEAHCRTGPGVEMPFPLWMEKRDHLWVIVRDTDERVAFDVARAERDAREMAFADLYAVVAWHGAQKSVIACLLGA